MTSNRAANRCHSVRTRAPWFVAVIPMLTLGACGSAGSTQQLPRPYGSHVTMTLLEQLAQSSASFDGDPSVTSAEAVLTTEQGASAVMGESGGPFEPVYLVQASGHFTANGASLSQTATKLPTGSYILLEVDALSGEELGAGIGTGDAHLASLGTVITLEL